MDAILHGLLAAIATGNWLAVLCWVFALLGLYG